MTITYLPAGNLPFSKAVISSSQYQAEISGQIGLDATGTLASDITSQTITALENMKTVLAEIGWSLDVVVKVRMYLTDMNDYAAVNEIYSRYFSKNFPARVVIAVKALPLGALIEIECTAASDTLPRGMENE